MMVTELYRFGNPFEVSSEAICGGITCSNSSKITTYTAVEMNIGHITYKCGSCPESRPI